MTHNPGFLALVNDAKSRIREVNIDQYRQMVSSRDPHLLIDVREDSEWGAGHAAGAVHLGKELSNATSSPRCRRKTPRSYYIAAVVSGPHSRGMH